MIQEEIQNWIYEIKEVDALSAKALLRVYEQLGLSAAADRLGAISSEQTNVEYASVWLWAVDRNPERRESLNKIREELTAKYCSENSKDVHLTGQQVFYELSFFTEYETTQRDGWYLYGLTQIKKAMKEGVFEYQAQITDLFKETFSVLRENFATLDALQRILIVAASYEACSQKILLPYKYQELLLEWYRVICRHERNNDQLEAAMVLMEMAKQKLEA